MAARHRSMAPIAALSRPGSRASTTSAASQHNDRATFFGASEKSISQVLEGPEAALLQYHTNVGPQAQQVYVLDHLQRGHAPMQHQQPQTTPSPFPAQTAFFAPHDTPFLGQEQMSYHPNVRLGSVSVQSGSEVPDDKRRKGSAVTATNDKELREMLARNEGRPLRDVAQEVIQKERTPMAEKTKQLFAMLWLRAVCKPAKTSVPRNRVYSQYANRCGTERVVPLNPASFGKLVRVIFPGIQTRRLGVRGESKYHYVDLALDDENATGVPSQSWNGGYVSSEAHVQRADSSARQQIDFNNIPHLRAESAAFPAMDQSLDMSNFAPSADRGPASKGRAFAYPDTRGMQPGPESATYSHILRFPSRDLPAFAENEPVKLPSIQPYLPARTDNDTAEALYALYRTHCTSLIDSIRFCKEKQFFRLYTSFHGTLTVPVQKLFTHVNLAAWIEQCDLVMYRTMVRFVSRLTLQAAPAVVINILSNISANLHGHIAKTFASQPTHVLEAKLRPATIFASLLYRLIRVNQAAHAAANLLTIDQNREQMWREWITMVNPKRVMEAELPECGYEETYKILTSEMRELLEPLQAPAFHEDPYGLQVYNFESGTGNFGSFAHAEGEQSGGRGAQSQISTENVLDRWSTFISSLPSRFPQASARTLLHCMSAVGTAALRDITIMNGLSYGHWWVLKIFVDEMALWMAEVGGFLEPVQSMSSPGASGAFPSPMIPASIDRSQSGSRMSSIGADAGNANGQSTSAPPPQQSQQRAPPPPAAQQQQQLQQSFFASSDQQSATFGTNGTPSDFGNATTANHLLMYGSSHGKPPQIHDTDIDDSGIGMSLMDDDLAFSKMGVDGAHGALGGINASSLPVAPL